MKTEQKLSTLHDAANTIANHKDRVVIMSDEFVLEVTGVVYCDKDDGLIIKAKVTKATLDMLPHLREVRYGD